MLGRLLFVAAFVVACGSTGLPDPAAPTQYDLADDQLISDLGSPLPEDIDWERNISGTTVLGSHTRPNADELERLAGAIAEVPPELDRVAAPRAVVRVPTISSPDPAHIDARAFTLGPDVYLVDRSFTDPDGPVTRFDLARSYFHELAHVAQFLTLSDAYIDSALTGAVPRVDPSSGSRLVADFAAATGWRNTSDDPTQAEWRLPTTSGATTQYGGVDPAEDMAEAVAMVVLGRADWIPGDRSRWVARWLDANLTELAAGKPWAPPGSREVLSVAPIYDEQEVSQLSERYSHVEPLYFELPGSLPGHRQLATIVEGELGRRPP
ncbi:MAG: hypothetical protein ACE5MI_08025, partial [Acidimicrobiia bacterium]